MNRRDFSKTLIAAGGVVNAERGAQGTASATFPNSYREPARESPTRKYDVVVVGGGTVGVVAGIAAARQGARTMLIEAKGYPGGGTVVEGETAFHSYFKLWKAFPGVKKRQVVKGIDNPLASGMMIASDHRAHMSTRNAVRSMGQGPAAGAAAALCSQSGGGTRDLKYAALRGALEKADVYFEG